MFVEKLPIPQVPEYKQDELVKLIDRNMPRSNKIEHKINKLIYQLYELDAQEVEFLERR
jgi:hypothetical protein